MDKNQFISAVRDKMSALQEACKGWDSVYAIIKFQIYLEGIYPEDQESDFHFKDADAQSIMSMGISQLGILYAELSRQIMWAMIHKNIAESFDSNKENALCPLHLRFVEETMHLESIINDFISGVSINDGWINIMTRGNLPREYFDTIINQISIDGNIQEFVLYCQRIKQYDHLSKAIDSIEQIYEKITEIEMELKTIESTPEEMEE